MTPPRATGPSLPPAHSPWAGEYSRSALLAFAAVLALVVALLAAGLAVRITHPHAAARYDCPCLVGQDGGCPPPQPEGTCRVR